jgi:hypothetical protein
MEHSNSVIKNQAIGKFFYLVFFPLFFVLHGYNENFGVISLGIIAELFIKYVLVTFVTLLGALLILKRADKAFLFAFAALCFYFFFGSFHQLLISGLNAKRLSSYSVLLPSIFLILGSMLFVLKKSKQQFLLAVSYLKWLLVAFVLFESSVFLYHTLEPKKMVGAPESLPLITAGPSNTDKPDIFFIVFDGYTSSDCLKNEFDFDNSSLDSLLVAHRFFISRSSKSNYNLTPFSVGSVLNCSYLKVDSQQQVISQKDLLSGVITVKNNWVIPFFQKQGYTIKNFGVFDFNSVRTTTYPFFAREYFIASIDDQTLLSSVMRDIGWNFQIKDFLKGTFRIPESYKRAKEKYLHRNEINYDHLIDELQTIGSSPKFVYCHIMLPHEPYFLNSDGSKVSDTAIILQRIDDRRGYLGQVAYSNLLLSKIIKLSDVNSKRKKVVIIMGDHGFRSYPDKSYRPKTFLNLNCIYTTDGEFNLYDGISPVNTFRFILHKYFNQPLSFLRDSSIYLVDPKYEKK